MKYFSDVQALSKEINSYVEHFVGLPLLVGLDHSEDYRELLEMLMLDPGKQIVRISESCSAEFPPNPNISISKVSKAAKTRPVVWIGAAQSIMLYNQPETQNFLIKLAGTAVKGPLILLCPFCCAVLEAIGRSYVKLGMNIITMPSNVRDIPSICVHADASSCTVPEYADGIKALLDILEDGKQVQTIHVVTSCEKKHFAASVYPYVESISAYQALCQKEPGLSAGTVEANGTEQQWQSLAKQVAEFGSLAELCEKKLCSVKQLPAEFPDYMIGANDERFLCFIALKAFCGAGNDYLGACLRKCQSPDDLLRCLYETILDISPNDPKLSTLLRQRSRLLQGFEENGTLLKDYCDKATIYGKNVLRYLSDDTEEERAALIHALCTYEYTPAEITALLKSDDGHEVNVDAGIVFLGNITGENMNEYTNMFIELPEPFHRVPFLDRIHGFIKGWELPRMNNDMMACGWTLNSEYYSSIMHELREDSSYAAIVHEMLVFPEKADTRDTAAIERICSAYMKLLFPHIRSAEDMSPFEFDEVNGCRSVIS